MPSPIRVDLPQQSYDIRIADNGLQDLGHLMASLELGKKVLVVSNPTIFRHYGERVIASLKSAGFEVAQVNLSAGERYKTLTSVQKIYDAALNNHLERSSTMVALGGGVIGDMTGFAAATWLRGINFVQVPTTLLAMVDAAVGGKTGVNHPQGKNLIGAFHQPRLVVVDPQVLNTLPAREFRAGMAEVIKYGVIWDAQLFSQLEQSKRLDHPRYLDAGLLSEILERSARAKADVVSKDEKEAGLRAILNYGHTIGHAVESLTGYRLVNHGEAVAIGMVAAGQLAVLEKFPTPLRVRQSPTEEPVLKTGFPSQATGIGNPPSVLHSPGDPALKNFSLALQFWDQEASERQLALIQKAGLPTQLPDGVDIEAILKTLQTDKKVKDGRVRFVLPTQIGAATVTDQVPAEQIRLVLQQMQLK